MNENLRKEIIDRKRMGDKKLHSETSLHQALEEGEYPQSNTGEHQDPGVSN